MILWSCLYEVRLKTKNWGIYKLFIITEKERVKERKWDGVGVMKDKELKIEDVKSPHTLGWSSYILLKILYIDSTEDVVSLFEVELQKPRNLSAHESEECDHGEGVGVYTGCLLWIVKVRGKDKIYIWISVWWKTKN